jgi:hypothetical protein
MSKITLEEAQTKMNTINSLRKGTRDKSWSPKKRQLFNDSAVKQMAELNSDLCDSNIDVRLIKGYSYPR